LHHGFPAQGTYTVTVTVRDAHGGVGSDSFVANVGPLATETNAAPVVRAFVAMTLSGNGELTATGSFAQHRDASWTRAGHFGDGSGLQPLALLANSLPLHHTYAAQGNFTVTVSVRDQHGGVGSDSFVVTVGPLMTQTNAAPVVRALTAITLVGSGELTATAS